MMRGRAVLIFTVANVVATGLSGCPRPAPAPSASASASVSTVPPSTAIADAGAVDAETTTAVGPTEPPAFALVIADIPPILSTTEAVFPLENGLVVARLNRLVPISGPMADLPPAQLHAGLPQNRFALTVRITGLTGRFPDAAFLAVSHDGVWGGGQLFRFDTDRWVPVEGSKRQSGLLAGASMSAGPAIVIQEQDFVGEDSGRELVLPLVHRPFPRDLLHLGVKRPALSRGFVASLPSGHFFFSGTEPEGRGVVEHFAPGSRVPVVREVPFFPKGAFARSPSDVYVVGKAREEGPRLAHFDGRAWTLLPPPPVPGTLVSVAALADGSVFVTSGWSQQELWRRSPEGAWTRVEPRYRAGGPAPLPTRVFVSAGGELHVIASEGTQNILLVQKGGPRTEPALPRDDESLASCKTLFLVIAEIYAPNMNTTASPQEVRRWLDATPEGQMLPVVEVSDDRRYLGAVVPDLALGKRLVTSPLALPLPGAAVLRLVCYQP